MCPAHLVPRLICLVPRLQSKNGKQQVPLSTATVSMVHSVPELMVSSEVSLSLSSFTYVHPAPPTLPWHLECPGTSRALSNGAFVKLYLLPPVSGLCPLVWNIQGTTGWGQKRGHPSGAGCSGHSISL